jgi:hypothetical protein
LGRFQSQHCAASVVMHHTIVFTKRMQHTIVFTKRMQL